MRYFIFIILTMFTFTITDQLSTHADDFVFYPDAKYSTNVPKPEEVIGHAIGERFTHYSDIVNYYRRLAEVSPKMKMIEYGQTYEMRKLHLLIISSQENLASIDRIRSDTARLGDPRRLSEAD